MFIRMDHATVASLRQAVFMVWGHSHGQMEVDMKVNGIVTCHIAWERCFSRVATDMKVNGEMASLMGKVWKLNLTAVATRVNGKVA